MSSYKYDVMSNDDGEWQKPIRWACTQNWIKNVSANINGLYKDFTIYSFKITIYWLFCLQFVPT